VTRARPTGFTLIELSAVLMIVAIASAVVAFRYHVVQRRAEADLVLAGIVDFDGRLRQVARGHDRPLLLVIDLQGNRLVRRPADEAGEEGPALQRSLALPSGCRLRRLVTPEATLEHGSLALAVSRQGYSASYALQLRDAAGRDHWVMVAGLTGLERRWQDRHDRTTEDIQAELAGRGHAD